LKGKPKVSIIIVNYNGGELLLKAVESIYQQTYNNFEVIVVDNASKDNSVKNLLIKYGHMKNLKVIKLKKNLGFLKGNNIGFQKTSKDSKYILMLNNDAYLEKDTIEKLVEILENNSSIGAIQPEIYFFDGSIQTLGNLYDIFCMGTIHLGNHLELDTNISRRGIIYITYPCGAVTLIRKELIDRIGFFDSKYFLYHDDIDLGLRIWLYGYKVAASIGVKAYHMGGYSSGKIRVDAYFHSTISRLSLILKYYGYRDITLYLPSFLLLYIIKLIGISLRFKNPLPIYSFFKGIIWTIKNLNHIVGWRKFIWNSVIRINPRILHKILIKNPFPILLNRYFKKDF